MSNDRKDFVISNANKCFIDELSDLVLMTPMLVLVIIESDCALLGGGSSPDEDCVFSRSLRLFSLVSICRSGELKKACIDVCTFLGRAPPVGAGVKDVAVLVRVVGVVVDAEDCA